MNKNEFNILICGSQQFDDENFVFGALDAFYDQSPFPISNIATSRFSGTCEFARNWVGYVNEKEEINIGHKYFSYDDTLEKNNLSLYEQVNVPDFILQKDPFFQQGKEKLLEDGIKMLMAFPNRDGVLGSSTLNIQRMAKIAGIPVFDCSQMLAKVQDFRKEENGLLVPDNNGLNNRHPAKKMR